MPRRIVTARERVEMLSPWRTAERADDFRWERSFDGPGGWILVTRNPDGNPVTVGTEPTRGQRSAALVSDDQMHTARVDAAEQVITRSGLAGETYHVPGAKPADARALGIDHWDLQRQHSAEAEKFVNGLVRENGFDHQNRGWVTVKPHPWAARDMSPNVQAWTDGGHIYLPGEHVNKLSLIHEAAHVLAGTQEGEGHGPDFQRTLHGLYHQHLGPEAADIFAGIVFPDHHTAALGPERPATAININDTHQDYTGQILRGEKTIETRNTNSLRTLIGGRYGISRTHDNSRKFPAMVVGYATLGEPKLYENAEDFDADYHLHRVGTDSPHHFNKSHTGVKFGYPLHDVEREPEPFPPGPGNRKWRSITAIQQPPEGLNFQHWATNKQIADHFGRFDMPIIAPAVTAHLDGEMVGSVEWHPHYDNAPERHGEVSMIDVPERHRRKGIGTALYDWARDNVEPKLHHSPHQSYDGEVWAAAEEDRQHDPSYRTGSQDKTLEQHLRDTYEPHPPGDPGLPESLVPHLMLPTDIAHHYREYDRPVDDENTAMLTRVIADQGIRQPLKISTDGTHAILHEGNHRVTVARQLGMSHVPVQVHLEKPGEVMTNSATSRPVPLEPVLGEWVNQNRQNLKSFWS